MIDLDTIEYYEYMREQEEKEDKIFKKVMDIYLEEESKIILEDIKKREEAGEHMTLTKEETRAGINKILERMK